MQVAPLGQRDQALDLRGGRLGLRLGRLDPLVVDHLAGQVHEERLAVRGAPRQLATVLLVAHRRSSGPIPAARRRAGPARAP